MYPDYLMRISIVAKILKPVRIARSEANPIGRPFRTQLIYLIHRVQYN